jgi:hypothetical protein
LKDGLITLTSNLTKSDFGFEVIQSITRYFNSKSGTTVLFQDEETPDDLENQFDIDTQFGAHNLHKDNHVAEISLTHSQPQSKVAEGKIWKTNLTIRKCNIAKYLLKKNLFVKHWPYGFSKIKCRSSIAGIKRFRFVLWMARKAKNYIFKVRSLKLTAKNKKNCYAIRNGLTSSYISDGKDRKK